jgi:hypothetical protein
MFGRLPEWSVTSGHLASLSEPMFKATLPPRYRAEDVEHYLKFKQGVRWAPVSRICPT